MPPGRGKTAPEACPKCGGDMWDNSTGKRNPRAPDYACKDKDGCGHGVWLSDTQQNARQGHALPGGPKPALILDSLMNRCVESAQAICGARFEGKETPDLVLNMATSIFISRSRGDGILKREKVLKAAPPPPPPPPPPVPEPEYEDPDDGLPF